MAPTNRRSSSSASVENGKVKKNNSHSHKAREPQKRWVFIANEEIVSEGSSSGPDSQTSICKLRHPRTGTDVSYLISCSGNIYQLECFDEKYHSWFIGDSVHSGGQIYFTNPVDPLFLALPYLINAGKKDRFMDLDQIICEEASSCDRLLNALVKVQLELVADVKEIDEDSCFYRYNKGKTLTWLKAKVDRLSEVLESKNIDVSTKGSHSAIFVPSKTVKTSKESYVRYSVGLISDNISVELEEQLKEHLGLEPDSEAPAQKSSLSENEPPAKRAKTSGEVAPSEDYSAGVDTNKAKSQNVKLTTAQKKLSKVDKTGMKSISSFFKMKN